MKSTTTVGVSLQGEKIEKCVQVETVEQTNSERTSTKGLLRDATVLTCHLRFIRVLPRRQKYNGMNAFSTNLIQTCSLGASSPVNTVAMHIIYDATRYKSYNCT